MKKIVSFIIISAIALVLTLNPQGNKEEITENESPDIVESVNSEPNQNQEVNSDVVDSQNNEDNLPDINEPEEEVETMGPNEDVASVIEPNPIEEKFEASSLKGRVICIDPGHQKKGNNSQEPVAPGSSQTKAKVSSGTRGVATQKYEYELNLEVALKLKDALLKEGAIVYMVREIHDVDISNVERAQLANEVKADISFRIHADGSGDANTNGFSILIPGTNYVQEDIAHKSKSIAEYLEKTISEGIENRSRGIITRNDLTGFNWSEVPAVLLEMGFMTNPEEDKRMSTEAFKDDLVKAIVEGMKLYFDTL